MARPDARAPDLSPDEIERLLSEYRRTGDRSARNAVVEAHLEIVGFQVRRFARGGAAPAEDLRQTALMAVIHAADRFEPGHGASFRTFATRTIEGELKRYLRDRSWAVRPPRGRQELHLQVSRATEELSHDLHRAPTVAEVAERLGVSQDSVLEGLEAGHARVAEHIDPGPRSDEEGAGGHVLGQTDPSFEAWESHTDLLAAVTLLDERDRHVLRMRFIDEMSQPEIADALGISQSYVSRILRSSLAQLRSTMEETTSPAAVPPASGD
jgi:RNA polymerase sigma-B factor